MTKEQGLSFYRIKTEWVSEGNNGVLNKIKTEELVMASCYTDAEKMAYEICEDQDRAHFGSVNIEIIKTKIENVIFNEILCQSKSMINNMICNYFSEDENTGVGLYAVKIIIITVDEKSNKEKKSSSIFYVPASSNTDATKRVSDYLKDSITDFVVRDAKFDKAEAIYWPKEIHQDKVGIFDAEK